MSTLKSVLLADRGVVRVAGPDASSLLQGLITNDMELLKTGSAIHAGLLSPQGKILFDFFVVSSGDGFLLDSAREHSGALVQRLTMYKLRADVFIEDVSHHYSVAAVWGGPAPSFPVRDDSVDYRDPRIDSMGVRLLVTLASDWLISEIDATPVSHDDYDALRIRLGVPEGGKDFGFGDTFVHEALFDQLNGVSFSKGCFVGQEIVSRMQHRGTTRRRVVPLEGSGPLPGRGTTVMAGSSMLGELGSVVGASGLSKLRLDRVSEAMDDGRQLVAGDVEVVVKLPDWATFTLGAQSS